MTPAGAGIGTGDNDAMPEWIVPALLVLVLLVVLWLAWWRGDARASERLERELRDEIARQAQASRADLGSLQQVLLTQSGDFARTQNEQIDAFRQQLAALLEQVFTPEQYARNVAQWLRHGWHVAVAYAVGFAVMLVVIGFHPDAAPRGSAAPAALSPR